MNEHVVQASRVLMGDSLGFHIIFVMLGLTLPILVSWFEWLGIRKKDPKLTEIARFWSKIMAVLVITGVVSGTVIALQMSLVWPGILKFGGTVIGLPFMFETYAFLIEAIFLALYMATWNNKKVSPMLHWVFGLFVILGSTLSAFMITAVNAWMNQPVGFTMVNGELRDINVWHALFSRTSFIEFFHSMPAYYFAVVLTVAGCYAFKILRSKKSERLSKKHQYDWMIINKLLVFAAVAFVATGVMADVTGKYLAKYEPTKLAAIELNYKDQTHAPFILGGTADGSGGIDGPHVKIPGALSYLSGGSTNFEVKGLDSVPKEEQPPLYVHTLFDIKLVIVGIFALAGVAYVAFRAWRPKVRKSALFLVPLSLIGLLAVIEVELGWMLTEIGRQPWAVNGYVTTKEALTKTHDITAFGYIFPAAFAVLFVVTYFAVRKIVKDHNRSSEGAKK